MATPSNTIYKAASGSGEQQFVAKGGVETSAAYTPYVWELRFNKDLYDALSTDEKAEVDALTLNDIIDAAYNEEVLVDKV